MIPSKLLIETLKKEIPLLKEDKIPAGFSATIDMMFSDENLILDRERFNILVSYWQLPPAKKEFFERYFPEQFKAGLDKFIIDALWHFGDLKRAYTALCEMSGIKDYFNEQLGVQR